VRVSVVLDVLGAALLVAAAAVIWWPAALVVAGTACLLASWRRSA
jgi:hypothetical protein